MINADEERTKEKKNRQRKKEERKKWPPDSAISDLNVNCCRLLDTN